MRAIDIMNSRVVTVRPDTPIEEIAQRMIERGVSGLPVVDEDGSVLGIVSEGDLIRRAELGTERRPPWWLTILAEPEERARRYIKTHGKTAREIMSTPVHSVEEHTPAAEIAALLEDRRIKRVPVLRNGKLVGIVSRANLLHGFAASKSDEPPKSDRELRAAVQHALEKETGGRDEFVDITVTDGVVYLWGYVPTQAELDAARVAAESAGAKSVVNHLRVVPQVPGW